MRIIKINEYLQHDRLVNLWNNEYGFIFPITLELFERNLSNAYNEGSLVVLIDDNPIAFCISKIWNEDYVINGYDEIGWVNLIYEILTEAILLPLFFFMGKAKDNNVEFVNRTRTGLLVIAGIYSALSAVVFIFTKPLLLSMAADPSIISASARYIRIESIANVISVLSQFILVALVTLNKSKYLYGLTALRFVLCVLFDFRSNIVKSICLLPKSNSTFFYIRTGYVDFQHINISVP